MGRKIPDRRSSGTTSVFTSGANASSLLTSRPVATSTMNPKLMSTAAAGARSPNAKPTASSTTACTTSVTTSRRTRPATMASRLSYPPGPAAS